MPGRVAAVFKDLYILNFILFNVPLVENNEAAEEPSMSDSINGTQLHTRSQPLHVQSPPSSTTPEFEDKSLAGSSLTATPTARSPPCSTSDGKKELVLVRMVSRLLEQGVGRN